MTRGLPTGVRRAVGTRALAALGAGAAGAFAGAPVVGAPVAGAPVAGVAVAVGVLVLTPTALPAQSLSGPRLEITLPTATTPMTLRVRDAIEGGRFQEMLQHGFDVRIQVRAELWRMGRVFNEVAAQEEFTLLLHFDQFDQVYDAARLDAGGAVTPLGTYRRLADAKAALALPYAPSLGRPSTGQRHYYAVRAEVATLDLKDLDELARWLRGELAPAVRGQRNPGTALGRGVRTLLTRVMGGEVRILEARSPRFVLTDERGRSD
jgi:hypothetical protein